MAPEANREHLRVLPAKNAFFDESGTHDGSEIFAMAGLISSYEAWIRFELKWRSILRAFGIQNGFHFTDFMARRAEFENDWNNAKRNDFMAQLCGAVSENIVVGIATAAFLDEYESVVPPDLREQLKHPYYFGLYTCLYQVVSWPHFKAKVSLPRELEFLFDRKPKFEGLAREIYRKVRDDLVSRVNPESGHPSAFGGRSQTNGRGAATRWRFHARRVIPIRTPR
jgi:hypothetical protein